MNDILLTIIQDTYSLTQLKNRIRVLRFNLVKTFFGGDETLNLTPEEIDWLKSLPENFYRKFTKDNIYQIFAIIDAQIPKLSFLTIYLTFEPDEPVIKEIGFFARKTFGLPSLLLDIKFDPRLIAGTALVWKGVYRDFSLHAKIAEKKQQLLQIFKSYLRQ